MTTNRTVGGAWIVAMVAVSGLAAALVPTVRAEAQPERAGSASGQGSAVIEASPAAGGAELPIKRITMYRSGVASLERRGLVEGSADVRLRFNTDQINDVLKSMVVLDLSGRGSINGVGYASKEPLARRLSSFGVDVSQQPSVAQLLSTLRGSRAVLRTGAESIVGTILGIEYQALAEGQLHEPVQVPFVNMVTKDGIRSVNSRKLASVELEDPGLTDELNKALSALAEYRADRVKDVEISLSGEGSREVVVGYVQETPVWKTSYRLVLDDAKSAETSAQQCMLQGWAIVENTTDEDWENVKLSLVSGRPVSFTMDLYEPLFLSRPEVPVPVEPGVGPKVYAEGAVLSELRTNMAAVEGVAASRTERRMEERSLAKAGRGGAPGAPPAAMADAASGAPVTGSQMSEYAARAVAQGTTSGEVFQYELERPVSIGRQRSAMLPIINAGIEGARVSIYSSMEGSSRPMRGVRIKNTSTMQLLPGPISVFDGGTYAGDAQVGAIVPGDTRLLSYAVDLDVMVTNSEEVRSEMSRLRIVDGLFERTDKNRRIASFGFKNKNQTMGKTLVLEYPKRGGETLVEPSQTSEVTEDLVRFDVAIAAAASKDVKVVHEWTTRTQVGLFGFDERTLSAMATNGTLSKAGLEAFRQASAKQAAVNDLQRSLERLDAEEKQIADDQTRTRENMKAIDKDTGVYKTYLEKFGAQEKRLDEIKAERRSLQERQRAAEADLREFLRTLNVE